jgi:hypothetical protein
MYYAGEVGADPVGVYRVLEAGRERRHHALGVIASPVEPAIHGVLHPVRLEYTIVEVTCSLLVAA